MDKEMIKQEIQRNIEDGLFDIAEDYIKQYRNIFGFDDEIASMEAIINIYSENYEDAMDRVRHGLKYNIYSSDLYYTMGNLYEINKKYENAYLCYEQALKFSEKEDVSKIIVENLNRLKEEENIKIHNYSIVILTYNQLEYTKVCIDSIRKYNSADNCEIIVVDNHSTDGTVEWLKNQGDIKYILNNENRGFPTGCNQGIELSQKDNDIFLLNNDTVIMPNSIFNLRMGLYSDKNIGATGAISNNVSYYQQISQQYEDFNGYMNFAISNNITNNNSYDQRVKLVGFAMLIKRHVLDKVGLLDERFTPGNYEDDDLSLRIIVEGYKLLLCKDSYIHHFGSVSFRKNADKYNELLSINSNKFKEKWGFKSEDTINIRYELVELIDEKKDRKMKILDMRCRTGATLQAIKNKHKNCEIYGVEDDVTLANIAGNICDVCNVNIETDELKYEDKFFDYIILDDILEKIYNPDKFIVKIKRYLKDSGYILASVSNVSHYSVIKDLIDGNLSEDNILNGDSIRFFTKNKIIMMLKEAEYNEIELGAIETYESEYDKKIVNQINMISGVDISKEIKIAKYLIKAKNYSKDNEKIISKYALLLRRLEFEVDLEKTEKEIMHYIQSEKIKYLSIIEIVKKHIINQTYVLNYIAIKCFENNMMDIVIPLLYGAYELEPENLDTNYNLAYVLNVIGEGDLALEYLRKLKVTNDSIEELIDVIHRGRN
ncbi:glycosyltransferase [Clostridium butyricum]|uniref:glycosyltransferase n=1 Tax=Clostridium butyricum TaxID=1492 RepID=UPI00374E8329